MKLSNFPDTDSLYIDLSDQPSKRVQLDKLVLSHLPSAVETAATTV